jgi:hypothetical protein
MLNGPDLFSGWFWLAVAAGIAIVLATHELGHAVLGGLAGYRIVAVGVGLRRPVLSFRVRRTAFYLARPLSLGLTLALAPTLSPSRGAQALLYLGGIAGNALCGVVAAALWQAAGRTQFLGMLAALSLLSALANAIPYRLEYGGAVLFTDGRRVLDVLRRASAEVDLSPGQIAATMRTSRDLCRSIGARTGEAALSLHLSLAELSIGDTAAAAEALADPSLGDASREPWTVPLEKVARALHAVATRAGDAAARVEEALAANAEDPAAIAIVRLAQAEAALDAGEPAGEAARVALEAARRTDRPALVSMAEALLLEAEPPDDLAAAAQALLARRGAGKLAVGSSIRCLATTARNLARAGRFDAARPMLARAAAMLSEAAGALPDERLRARMLAWMSALLKEAVALAAAAPVPLFVPEPRPPQRRWGERALMGVLAALALLLIALPVVAVALVVGRSEADPTALARSERRAAAEIDRKLLALRAADQGSPEAALDELEDDLERVTDAWDGDPDEPARAPELREALARARKYLDERREETADAGMPGD